MQNSNPVLTFWPMVSRTFRKSSFLVPRSRVDDLEEEVKFLKIMVRQMAERISTLEKAN